MVQKPFWQTTALADMNADQWEAICDGCAKCCLVKLHDEETGDITFTNLACCLLDTQSCRCTDYARRTEIVPDCVKLSKDNLDNIDFMPPSCAYRLLNEGKPLPLWHPLVSGTRDSVAAAGMSAKGRIISENDADDDIEAHVVDWPMDKI